MNDVKITAALHGVDLDKASGSEVVGEKDYPRPSPETDNAKLNIPMFKDPSEYEGMSPVEREALTHQMMSKHKAWVEGQKVLMEKNKKG